MPAIHPLRDRVAGLLATAGIQLDGGGECDPVIHDQRFHARVLAQGSLGLGESWMAGWWDVLSLDGLLARLLQAHIDQRVHGVADMADGLRARLLNLQVERRSGEVGRRHYDLGNEFYAAMLGRRLVYSCGYWRDAHDLGALAAALRRAFPVHVAVLPGGLDGQLPGPPQPALAASAVAAGRARRVAGSALSRNR